LWGKKLFRGLGGSFGVFSEGENLGDVLVLVRLVIGGAGGKYELFVPSVVCGFEGPLPSFDIMAELRLIIIVLV
jgi:hypothetical protein